MLLTPATLVGMDLDGGVQVVWLKRDLRVRDHAPLRLATEAGPVLVLYVDEPSLMKSPEYARCHHDFIDACLADVDAWCRQRGGLVVRRTGEAVETLERIHAGLGIARLWSHEESGLEVTYARDRAVAAWASARGVPWTECVQTGVVRRLRTRNGWAQRWHAFMARAPQPEPERIQLVGAEQLHAVHLDEPHDHADGAEAASTALHERLASLGIVLAGPVMPDAQRGGEREARAVLRSFVDHRSRGYRGGISAPLRAEVHGSRLSPYLAWGAISPHTVLAATRSRMRTGDGRTRASLKAFESRMAWRDHFTQKLEDEPRIETSCIHRGFEGMREREPNEALLTAWSEGRTGYPMVDAVQRCLAETGFVNFRMRAMVTSFAAYHLWLDWRALHPILAKRFLDFEPGIHISQLQMQSGVTGINAIRIYNPLKQAADQDPNGAFVRRWVPELANVPDTWLGEPHKMDASLQQRFGVRIGADYPAPVVDNATAMAKARKLVHAWRAQPHLQAEARRVQARHGSRAGAASGAKQGAKRAPRAVQKPPEQGQLDF
jgi:deoxyribodipyrimidine photo-lyase